MNILLNYFFPITTITPTPAASTSYLKQCLVLVSPADEVEPGTITECTTPDEVAALTDNADVVQLFSAGLQSVFVLPLDSLDDLADAIDGHESDWFTILISSDFDDSDIAAINDVAAVKASKKIQDILYTAKVGGTAGNSITIKYTDGATAGAETCVVTGTAIVVGIDDGVSTAAQIKTKVEATSDAMDLLESVDVDAGDESDTQSELVSPIPLENGAAAIASGVLDVGLFKGVVGLALDDKEYLAQWATAANRCGFYAKSENGAKNEVGAIIPHNVDSGNCYQTRSIG